MSRPYSRDNDSPNTLSAGTWQPDNRGVLHWHPAPVVATVPRPLAPLIAILVACPTCRAKVNQACKSTGGNTVSLHTSRLVPRYCHCGARLSRRRTMCEPCRQEARRETYRLRERRAPTSSRRAS